MTEALSYFEQHPNPIIKEQPAEEAAVDSVSNESEMSQDYNAEEDFRLCGSRISDLLKDG